MPEAKGRREGNILRHRSKAPAEVPVEDFDQQYPAPRRETSTEVVEPPPNGNGQGAEGGGFDAETNSRYEEIKRGGTHITQLQQMTMPQLLKCA
jgi:transcription termination factor Rho